MPISCVASQGRTVRIEKDAVRVLHLARAVPNLKSLTPTARRQQSHEPQSSKKEVIRVPHANSHAITASGRTTHNPRISIPTNTVRGKRRAKLQMTNKSIRFKLLAGRCRSKDCRSTYTESQVLAARGEAEAPCWAPCSQSLQRARYEDDVGIGCFFRAIHGARGSAARLHPGSVKSPPLVVACRTVSFLPRRSASAA